MVLRDVSQTEKANAMAFCYVLDSVLNDEDQFVSIGGRGGLGKGRGSHMSHISGSWVVDGQVVEGFREKLGISAGVGVCQRALASI